MFNRNLFFLLYSLLFAWTTAISCKFYISPDTPARLDVNEGMMSVGSISHGVNGSQECLEGFQQCFVVWTFTPGRDEKTKLLLQGCWKGNSKECASSRCVANSDINSEYLANNRFCCCSSSYCNENYTYEYVAKVVPQVEVLVVDHVESDEMTFTVAIIASFLILAILGVTYLFYRTCSWPKPMFNYCATNPTDKLPLTENGPEKECNKTDGSLLLNSVTLKRPLYIGRYSTVWLAETKANSCTVALKLYNDGFQRYGINEIRVLTLPRMKHEGIIECLAAAALTESSSKSGLWLMTPYMPGGSLMAFLKSSTLSWESMCKMASSVVQAVAYLHAEIKTTDSYKPAIAHRDLNSRNILVKQDGTCLLCDLAFAVMLESSGSGGSDRRDATLAEVGTVRYMAPELLEGAANLRDPETTLKQLDVYALGLVLWEIVSRCADIHGLNGDSVPAYELPYARDVSATPTLEEMQRVVCKNKKRPSFPTILYRPKAGPLHAIREVIEDCWDQDSDARITSLCASERLLELQATLRTDNFTLLQDYGVTGRESPGIVSRLVGANLPYLQMAFSDSTTDTTRTDTSGFVSVGLGSSDRGRSCTSSLGYQTHRSDSSAMQLVQSPGGQSVDGQTAIVDSGINNDVGNNTTDNHQSRVQGSHLAEVDNGAVWNGCRSSAKDHLYPLLLMKSAKRAGFAPANDVSVTSSLADSALESSPSMDMA